MWKRARKRRRRKANDVDGDGFIFGDIRRGWNVCLEWALREM